MNKIRDVVIPVIEKIKIREMGEKHINWVISQFEHLRDCSRLKIYDFCSDDEYCEYLKHRIGSVTILLEPNIWVSSIFIISMKYDSILRRYSATGNTRNISILKCKIFRNLEREVYPIEYDEEYANRNKMEERPAHITRRIRIMK